MKTLLTAAAIIAAFTLPALAEESGQPKECSTQTAVKANAFIKKYKHVIEVKDHEASGFIAALSEVSGGKVSLHDIELIRFVEVNPEDHTWMVLMFGAPVKGKDCFFGAIPMPVAILQKIVEKMQEDKGGI